jgi:ATP-binding cassette subfamily F protein 3
VADGKCEPFEGDLDDYRKFLLTGDNAPTRRPDAEPEIKPSKEDARREAAEKRQSLKPLKERIELAESQIATLNLEIGKLDKALSDPLLFTKDPAKGSAVSKKRAEAARKLAAAESQWLAAQTDYDAAMG